MLVLYFLEYLTGNSPEGNCEEVQLYLYVHSRRSTSSGVVLIRGGYGPLLMPAFLTEWMNRLDHHAQTFWSGCLRSLAFHFRFDLFLIGLGK